MIEGKIAIGTVIGCRYRWPCAANHPDCWQPPLKGTVLALDNPRAWMDCLKYPICSYPEGPSQQDLTDHVQKCLNENLLMKDVPVLYVGVDGKEFVQWDDVEHLHPYDEEYISWEIARNNCRARQAA